MCRDEHRDLSELLAEVRYTVQDSRFLWCTGSIGFETTVTRERGIVLGGAMSPMFLLDRRDTELSYRAPWTVKLYRPRILVLREEDASSIQEWVPMLEALAKKEESLLVVAEKMDPTVLNTLIVNFRREVLSCCAVWNGSLSGIATLANVHPTLPTTPDKLHRASQVWVRKGATVIFPEPDDRLGSSTREIVVVNIGGTDVDNQLARMRAFMKALSREKDAFV